MNFPKIRPKNHIFFIVLSKIFIFTISSLECGPRKIAMLAFINCAAWKRSGEFYYKIRNISNMTLDFILKCKGYSSCAKFSVIYYICVFYTSRTF